MRIEADGNGIHTTIGDFIVAVVDAALEVSKDERKAYQITGVVLNKFLRASSHKADQHNASFYDREWLH
jgi:hypothetical protein